MAVKTCKKCGESNKETASICIVCSSSLKNIPLEGTLNSEKELPGVSSTSVRSRTTCSFCNERVEPDALKCKYCGSTISRAPSPKTKNYYSNTTPSNTPDGCAIALLFIATFFIPIVGLIVGGIFAFSEDDNKHDIGKALLIFGLIMIFVGFIIGIAIL